MSIKDWPKADRPREKLFAIGARNLSDTELLSILIGTGDRVSGRSALEHARDLIGRYRSFRALANVPAAEICSLPGIGPAKGARIYAALEIAARMGGERICKGGPLQRSEEVFKYYYPRLRDVKKEIFLAILLDSKNRIIREEQISEGSLDVSVVHPREVFNPVIRESAASVIFVHNHPSGDPSPSQEDVRLTHRLVEVGDLLGVKILDHIIIGEGEYVSFCDSGLLRGPRDGRSPTLKAQKGMSSSFGV
jgi:DNA repair protein RadC